MLKLAVIITVVLDLGYAKMVNINPKNPELDIIECIQLCNSGEPTFDLCKFSIYIRDSQRMDVNNCEEICTYVPKKDIASTVFLVNGEESSVDFVPRIRHEIFQVEDANIISVEWKNTTNNYDTCKIDDAKRDLKKFVDTIVDLTISKRTLIHIVGFSLGAYVAFIGPTDEEKVARITALSPARLPSSRCNNFILDRNSADYVEVIHTDGGLLGFGIRQATDHLNFYANNGKSQPGCSSHICCHERAYLLFAASMTGNLKGQQCRGDAQIDLNLCKGRTAVMGNNELKSKCVQTQPDSPCGLERFRVNTKRNYPYY